MSEPDVSGLLTVAQAIAVIDGVSVSPRLVELSLQDADGLVLAEPIRADRDAPPFDKSVMDGFAVRAVDAATAPAELKVVGEVAAGQAPERAVGSGEAIAIMTGAPLPAGADAVVPVEDVEREDDRIRIRRATAPGKSIAPRASDVAAGAVVLETATRLTPAAIAVAASVGAAKVRVIAKPRAAVLSTGDELVPVEQVPGPAQIRNSNSVMLVALLKRLGCDVTNLGVVRDEPGAVRDALRAGLAYDALFVTGGMSMGEYDYVPRTLLELGVDLRVTKLKIKPGKPFVFGVGERPAVTVQRSGKAEAGSGFGVQGSGKPTAEGSSRSSSLNFQLRPLTSLSSLNPEPQSLNPSFVFGLPGNPVSAFVCTVRLASRLIERLSGAAPRERWGEGALTDPLPANGPREFYQPVVLADGVVRPLGWKGSADIYSLARANALLVRAENEPPLPAGSRVRVLEV